MGATGSTMRPQPLPSLLLLTLLTTSTASPFPPTHCPHQPAGRLHQTQHPPPQCPVPGRIGIFHDDTTNDVNTDIDPAVSWTYPPKCMTQTTKSATGDNEPSRIDCLFTSAEFRNGHGTSIVTSTTTASELLSVGAFHDRPAPLAAQRRAAAAAGTAQGGGGSGLSYEIVNVGEEKGDGVVATRVIRQGEIIMVDVPAVMMGMGFLADTPGHHRRRVLKQAMRQLSEETRAKLDRLQRSEAAKYEVDAILGRNSHAVEVGGEVHVGLFAEVAKINHACRPNAYYRFSESRLTMEVVAFRRIEPGEEIFMSYVPLETPVDERRRYLHDHWGFNCACTLCRASDYDANESRAWREKVKSLQETIASAREQGYYPDAITMTHEWLLVAGWDGTPPFLPEWHGTLADLHLRKGDMANATRYARMAMDGWAKLGSVDDEPLERARMFLKRVDELNEGK